jgi:hypothetical protein
VRCGTQDVFDLVRSCERVQVRRSRGMAGSAGCLPSGFGGRFLRSLVRGQRAASLQLGALCTLSESPRRFDGYPRPSVARVSCLEDRQCLLGALCGVASDRVKVLRTQSSSLASFGMPSLSPSDADPKRCPAWAEV